MVVITIITIIKHICHIGIWVESHLSIKDDNINAGKKDRMTFSHVHTKWSPNGWRILKFSFQLSTRRLEPFLSDILKLTVYCFLVDERERQKKQKRRRQGLVQWPLDSENKLWIFWMRNRWPRSNILFLYICFQYVDKTVFGKQARKFQQC